MQPGLEIIITKSGQKFEEKKQSIFNKTTIPVPILSGNSLSFGNDITSGLVLFCSCSLRTWPVNKNCCLFAFQLWKNSSAQKQMKKQMRLKISENLKTAQFNPDLASSSKKKRKKKEFDNNNTQ